MISANSHIAHKAHNRLDDKQKALEQLFITLNKLDVLRIPCYSQSSTTASKPFLY